MPDAAILHAGVSLSEVATWKGRDVEFRVRKDSEMAPLGEGIALGQLQGLVQAQSRISVETTFAVEPDADSGTSPMPFFDSAFGLAITVASSSVRDSRGRDVRDTLRRYLWRRLKQTRGVLGIGDRLAVVSYDPTFPVPPCLQQSGHEFPLRDYFRTTLRQLTQTLGRHQEFASLSEEDVITFLYEAAKNSYDHGRVDSAGKAIAGVRGVLLEKLLFANLDEVHKRRDLPPILRDYVLRVFGTSVSAMFLTYTVSDIGPGIHCTLPSLEGESSFGRLCRAFQSGQSRKPSGAINRGRGLDLLLAAVKQLGAFLVIRSADLLAFVDGSTPADAVIKPWPDSLQLSSTGTSLSLLWPIRPRGDLLEQLDRE